MAAHLDTHPKTTGFGIAEQAVAPACTRIASGQDEAAAASRMSYERNADLTYALVARCLR